MCCFFNKAYLRIPFDIIKKPKVILLYHCWNHVLFSFIVVKDAASHSTNYSLPRGGGVWYVSFKTGGNSTNPIMGSDPKGDGETSGSPYPIKSESPRIHSIHGMIVNIYIYWIYAYHSFP